MQKEWTHKKKKRKREKSQLERHTRWLKADPALQPFLEIQIIQQSAKSHQLGARAAGWGPPGAVSCAGMPSHLGKCGHEWQWTRQVAGTRLVWGTPSGQGSVNLMKGASEQGKSGSLLLFLPTHRIPNTMDVSSHSCESSPGSHRQHSGIYHQNHWQGFFLPGHPGLPRNCKLKCPQGKAWTQGCFSPKQKQGTPEIYPQEVCSYCQARIDGFTHHTRRETNKTVGAE